MIPQRQPMAPHHLATLFCLVVALLLYFTGLREDAQGVMVVGACFEGIFWMRVFRKDSASQRSTTTIIKN